MAGKSRRGAAGRPPEQWTRNDIVGEGFRRWQLDRPFGPVNDYYAAALGQERSPLARAATVARFTGSVAIFDDGCGTGRTLKTFVDAVRNEPGCEQTEISGTGLNWRDYSDQSLDPQTRHAFANGDLEYIVADAEDMAGVWDSLTPGTQDVVIAHHAIRYSRRPGLWLAGMMQVAKTGGWLFCNMPDDDPMVLPDSEFTRQLDDWRESGIDVVQQRYRRDNVYPTDVPPDISLQSIAGLPYRYYTVQKPFGYA
ncbi:MAG TPA: methyltransferase domain-containing protein [Patescibacteria group bacterium]|nr:methyltransferase domain-containing protein [Patescibacteria group bacterium]